ncbi:MAG: 30S ribosomal protein S27e [Thaumarchaeota archaeon]|nr:30S ribosomal protein S27e [Candidatus Calditenuaceae archaeon]MCX8203936.1 30S ribosomal protein S27e [Nitrososphaeria archaeon]MDW8043076.1 30S ribosomal protein S27e [Nitrososphaerota archaeon]
MSRVEIEGMIPQPRSRFLLVSCLSCGNKQVVFDSAKTVVRCAVCREVLAVPRGGKSKVLGKVVAVLT